MPQVRWLDKYKGCKPDRRIVRLDVKLRLRFLLPLLAAAASAPLMVWDIHNQRVIMRMGMGWDIGAPLWPYQTPDTVLNALSLPASFLANGFSNLFALYGPLRYLFFYPAILVLWWLIGVYFDQRRRNTAVRKSILSSIALYLLFAAFMILGVLDSRWPVEWWWTYSRSFWTMTDLILLRLIAPPTWWFLLGAAAFDAALRRSRLGTPTDDIAHLS